MWMMLTLVFSGVVYERLVTFVSKVQGQSHSNTNEMRVRPNWEETHHI
jgi:hypothetical protein